LGPTLSSSAAIGFRKGDAVVPMFSPFGGNPLAKNLSRKAFRFGIFGNQIRGGEALVRQWKLAGI
jgi:hypothetical protein